MSPPQERAEANVPEAQPTTGAHNGVRTSIRSATPEAVRASNEERPTQTGAQGGRAGSGEPSSSAGREQSEGRSVIEALPPAFRPEVPVGSTRGRQSQGPIDRSSRARGDAEGQADVTEDVGGVEVRQSGRQGPVRGRVERRRGLRAAGRQHRGRKSTESQRRHKANRPMGRHPQVLTWDLLPVSKRFSLAGQERSIYRSRGFLVSRFDFTKYYALLENNARELPEVFPQPPMWWPENWGKIPITLPWEASLYRAHLVSADENAAIWKELYQLFLEQLAGGWDLWFHTIEDRSNLEPLPAGLAQEIVKHGGFAFCSGSAPSTSLAKFLEIHDIEGGAPDQRRAKAEAWNRIKMRKREEEEDRAAERSGLCDCARKHERAVRRLGVEALVVEAVDAEELERLGGHSEKLAAVASASLRFAIDADQKIGRLLGLLAPPPNDPYQPHPVFEAYSEIRDFRRLADFLPSRVASLMTRLS